jgi:uncharacterized protein YkwD
MKTIFRLVAALRAPRRLIAGIALGAVAVLWLAPSVWAQERRSDIQNKIFEKVNAIRQDHGAAPLVRHPALEGSAGEYAAFLSKNDLQDRIPSGQAGHELDGRTLAQRIYAYRVPFAEGKENLHAIPNQDDPATKIVNDWMNSEVHRNNLLGADWRDTGIAVFRTSSGWYYAVQDYAMRTQATTVQVTVVDRTSYPLTVQLVGDQAAEPARLDRYQTGIYTMTSSNRHPIMIFNLSGLMTMPLPVFDRHTYTVIPVGTAQFGPFTVQPTRP